MICQECYHRTCITCDAEMHPGVSCREKAAERELIQQAGALATQKYLKTQAKACPVCGVPTQKTGGCDHMICKSLIMHVKGIVLTPVVGEICDHEYCWVCLADHGPIHEEGNHRHEPTCRHHSDNL